MSLFKWNKELGSRMATQVLGRRAGHTYNKCIIKKKRQRW